MPQTIAASNSQFQTDIRSKVSINSISPDNVADMGDTCVLLALERGLYILASTAGFATLPGTEAQIAIVENVGIFKWASSGGAADGVIIFDGPSSSKWIRIMQTNVGGGALSLGDLSNVTITAPVAGDMLQINGSGEWVNVDPPSSTVVYVAPEIMAAIALTAYLIQITFNKPMQFSSSNGLLVEIPTANTIAGIYGSGTSIVILEMATAMTPATAITLSYDPTTGDLRDLENNELAIVTDDLVLNAIEIGDISGGAEFDLLIKNSAADYDIAWATFEDIPTGINKIIASLTANGTLTIPDDATIISFSLLNSGALIGFKVGSGAGLDDIISTQDFAADGEWKTFAINYRAAATTTWYVEGVSGTVDIELINI